MCTWDRFCTFAREPERRKVRSEAKVSVNGILYDVDPELVGRDVILWFGIFDNQLYVELGDKKYGPYKPSSGPIPLKRFRSFKKTMAEKRADDIEELSKIIHLPITTLTTDSRSKRELLRKLPDNSLIIEFDDPDPFNEIYFSNIISAKKYVSSILGIPLAKLSDNEIAIVNDILDRTLEKKKIEELIRDHFSFKKYYL